MTPQHSSHLIFTQVQQFLEEFKFEIVTPYMYVHAYITLHAQNKNNNNHF